MDLLVDRKKHSIIFRESYGLLVAIHRAYAKDTKKILKNAELGLVRFEHVIEKYQKNKEILKDILGTFHVSSMDIAERYGLYRFDGGVIAKGAGSVDDTILITGGDASRLIMEVHGNRTAEYLGRRFTLYSYDGSDFFADRIVGVKPDGMPTPMKLLAQERRHDHA